MTEDKRLEGPMVRAGIEELRELEAKATPGPWTNSLGTIESSEGWHIASVLGYVGPITKGANAALIAAMRNALPRVLAMLEQPSDEKVREAVEYIETALNVPSAFGGADAATYLRDDMVRTLLSYVHGGLERDNAALRAQIAELEGNLERSVETAMAVMETKDQRIKYECDRARRAEAELAEERAFHGECPGGCGYWKEAAKRREGERDEARAKCERLEKVRDRARICCILFEYMDGKAGLSQEECCDEHDCMEELVAALAECERLFDV